MVNTKRSKPHQDGVNGVSITVRTASQELLAIRTRRGNAELTRCCLTTVSKKKLNDELSPYYDKLILVEWHGLKMSRAYLSSEHEESLWHVPVAIIEVRSPRNACCRTRFCLISEQIRISSVENGVALLYLVRGMVAAKRSSVVVDDDKTNYWSCHVTSPAHSAVFQC